MVKLKDIYEYANRHLRDWFPKLPSYTAFIQRLNKVADTFAPLLEIIVREQEVDGCNDAWLIDSFPVALAKHGHRFKAKVAPVLANAVLHQEIIMEYEFISLDVPNLVLCHALNTLD
jgi:hypothetical protein